MLVYISHAARDRDKELARHLSRCLTDAGFRVWNAEAELYPGDNYAKKIGEALEAADVMIVLITPGAFESSWLLHEVQFALTAGNFGGRLIPLAVGRSFEAGSDVPWVLLTPEMSPLYIESIEEGAPRIVERVKSILEKDYDAAK